MIDIKRKHKVILAALILSIYLSYKHQYRPQYKILPDSKEAFAEYSDGLIYIGNKKYVENINNLNEGDILIEDKRYGDDDPDMIIYNSCKIIDKDVRNEILEVICEYEKNNPSAWDRSIESMRVEWFMHNVCYYLNYKTDHTTDVDLNNYDEEKYDNEVIRLLLKI